MSSRIISSKVVRFLPETCQRPVRPGAALKRSICHGRYSRYSYGTQGRGPTRLISPFSTFKIWGSSSSPVARSSQAPGIRRLSRVESIFTIGLLDFIKLHKRKIRMIVKVSCTSKRNARIRRVLIEIINLLSLKLEVVENR